MILFGSREPFDYAAYVARNWHHYGPTWCADVAYGRAMDPALRAAVVAHIGGES